MGQVWTRNQSHSCLLQIIQQTKKITNSGLAIYFMCGEMHCQKIKCHSTENEEFETHPRLLISHLIYIVFVLFI
jgi:hypothetical protein